MIVAKKVAEFESLSVCLKPKETFYELNSYELTVMSRELLTAMFDFRGYRTEDSGVNSLRERYNQARFEIKCETRLGGMLRYYYRDAA